MLTDVETVLAGGEVRAKSVIGFSTTNLRDRITNPGTPERPVIEGDILVILPDQPGAEATSSGMYELEVIDNNTLKLVSAVSKDDPLTLVYTTLVPTLFTFGTGLKCCILRRALNPVLRGADLSTTSGTPVVTSAGSDFLLDEVGVGDCLIIEEGANQGEYIIDSLENEGVAASITVVTGPPKVVTVTGLTGMTLGSVGGLLEIFNGDHVGVYKITVFISATSVEIRSPHTVDDTGNPNIQWRETPRAPFITSTQLALKDALGAEASLTTLSNQVFRIIRPLMVSGVVQNAKSLYNVVDAQIEVEVLDPVSGDPFDIFTPGMIGLTIDVSGSDNPVNDGVFLVIDYLHSGKVVTDSASTTSDAAGAAAAGATVRIG